MATYLQGVSLYVPQIQPYQPDLNFESNLLQTKQSQYDSNWKALNNIYGQYFYADLTRDPNIKKKEQLLKNIDFNLQRVAGLDLSLSQNVDQAAQVFKPFYEDNVLMKDMAWTKTKNAQRGYGMSLKNDPDTKKSGMYWNDGIKAIDYLTEEFKNSTDEESMSFGNVSYTANRNVFREARELAKKSGISMETPSFSTDGRWMYQTKNGEQIMEPLSKLFESELGNDPGIQDYFRTKTYVQRKDYVEENAAQFNGDKKAAEMRYLQDNFNVLKDQVRQSYKRTQEVSDAYDAKIKDAESQLKNGTAREGTDKYLADLKRNKEINEKVLERFKSQNDEFFTGEGEEFKNPYGDVKSLRMKVDNGLTWNQMSKALNEAAQYNAYIDYKVTQKENPYAVIAEKHSNEMAQIRLRNAGTLAAVNARNKGEADNIDRKWKLESGTSFLEEKPVLDENGNPVIDPVTGKAKTKTELVDNDLAIYARKGFGEGGNSVSETDTRQLQKYFSSQVSRQYAQPFFNTTRDILNKLNASGQFTYEDLKRLQYGDRELKKGEKVKPLDQFMNDMSKYALSNPFRLDQVKSRIDGYFQAHAHLKNVQSYKTDYDIASMNYGQIVNFAKNNADYMKKTSDYAKQELLRIGADPKYVNLAFDEKTGRLRSQEEFEDLVQDKYGEKTTIFGGKATLYDPITKKQITVTDKNYKDVTYNIGKHIFENGSQPGAAGAVKFYKSGDDAKRSIQSALGTNEGMDAVYIDKNGNKIDIKDNRDRIKSLIKSNKSYIIKQTNTGGWFSDNGYVIQEVDVNSQDNKSNVYNQLGKAYVFNSFNGNVIVGNNKAAAKYSEIKSALDDAYRASDIQKQPIPTMFGTHDPGTGVYAESSLIQVLPMNRQAPGTRAMLDFFNTFQNLDLDGNSAYGTFGGTDVSAINKSLEKRDDAEWFSNYSENAKTKFIMKELYQAMSNPKMAKLKPFDVEYQSIAEGSLGKEAMIIRPSMEFLKQYVSTNDKPDEQGQGNNILTLGEYNSMLQHGISVIAPNGTFDNNTLAKGAKMPLFVSNAIYNDAIGQPTEYSDSYGMGTLRINHDKPNDAMVLSIFDKKHPENNIAYNVPYRQAEDEFRYRMQQLNALSDPMGLLSNQYNKTYNK